MGAKVTLFSTNRTLNIKGKCISFEQPLIQGILNFTPDSFFEESRVKNIENALERVDKMLVSGADIIDVGGQSTRPGAKRIEASQELRNVIPVIEKIRLKYPDVLISVDTFYAAVAKESIDAGANIVNDISGGRLDEKMFETVAGLKVPYILTHSKGNPSNMKSMTDYEDILSEMLDYFQKKIQELTAWGVEDIILDPGFGFAKTIDQNYLILKNLDVFKVFNLPVLVGISRKSMIFKKLQKTPEEALNGTTVLNTFALTKGASVLRVHDVSEAKEAVELMQLIKNA